jgi:hypothetical protein
MDFIRYLRDIFVQKSDFIRALNLKDEAELFKEILEDNYILLAEIHDFCCSIRNIIPDDEFDKLRNFISVNYCDFD